MSARVRARVSRRAFISVLDRPSDRSIDRSNFGVPFGVGWEEVYGSSFSGRRDEVSGL